MKKYLYILGALLVASTASAQVASPNYWKVIGGRLTPITSSNVVSSTNISFINGTGTLRNLSGALYITTSTGLGTANFGSANVSQWLNNVGFLNNASITAQSPLNWSNTSTLWFVNPGFLANASITAHTGGGVGWSSTSSIYLSMTGVTCGGTDKVSFISATGTAVCTADQSGGGGGSANVYVASTTVLVSNFPFWITAGSSTLSSTSTLSQLSTGVLNASSGLNVAGGINGSSTLVVQSTSDFRGLLTAINATLTGIFQSLSATITGALSSNTFNVSSTSKFVGAIDASSTANIQGLLDSRNGFLFTTATGTGNLQSASLVITGVASTSQNTSGSSTIQLLNFGQGTSTTNLSLSYGTGSRCLRLDANKNVVVATADCPNGDTTGAGGGANVNVTTSTIANALIFPYFTTVNSSTLSSTSTLAQLANGTISSSVSFITPSATIPILYDGQGTKYVTSSAGGSFTLNSLTGATTLQFPSSSMVGWADIPLGQVVASGTNNLKINDYAREQYLRSMEYMADPAAVTWSAKGWPTIPVVRGSGPSSTDDNVGVWHRMSGSGTSTPNSSSGLITAFNIARPAWSPDFIATIRTGNSVTSTDYKIGFTAGQLATTTLNTAFAGFTYASTSPTQVWRFQTSVTSSQTVVTTTVAFSTSTPYLLETYFSTVDGTLTAYGLINGNLVATSTTNLPASSTQMGVASIVSGLGVASSTVRQWEIGRWALLYR